MRRGYSLAELLIVLAIMAALAALVQPSVRGLLDKSRLNAGAKQVQAALAKTRALAIREGAPVWFRFEPGGQQWWIERDPAIVPLAVSVDAATGVSAEIAPVTDPVAATDVSPAAAGSAGLQGGETSVPVSGSVVLRMDRLPEGVTFSAVESGQSDRVRFSVSGRTTGRQLRLSGQREFVVDLTIRGLTGLASSTTPFRAPPVIALPLGESAAVDSELPAGSNSATGAAAQESP
jgi:prepilin-type N-terminal cleavage/methylation domain-containing protein